MGVGLALSAGLDEAADGLGTASDDPPQPEAARDRTVSEAAAAANESGARLLTLRDAPAHHGRWANAAGGVSSIAKCSGQGV